LENNNGGGAVGIGMLPKYTFEVHQTTDEDFATFSVASNDLGLASVNDAANAYEALDLYGTTVTTHNTSDARLKTNIQNLSDTQGLAGIMQLRPVTFNWKDVNQATTTQTGLIAQEVQPVFPDLVQVSPLGSTTITLADGSHETVQDPLTLNYAGLIVPAIKAIQDIANITSTFQQNLIAWLGNAQNGIADLFALRIHTTQICVGDGPNDPTPVCLTKPQLAALLSQTASAQTPESVSQSDPQNPSTNLSESVSSTTPPTIPESVSSATSSATQSATSTTSAATPDSTTSTSSVQASSPQAPQIQINGDNPATIQVGDTYNDLGAAITGPQQDLNLGIKVSVDGGATTTPDQVRIDTTQVGTHTILYSATDQNGLTSSATRKVQVQAASSTTPTATDASTTTSSTTSSTSSSTDTSTATSTNSSTTTQATSTSS
jgi:Chaperone of endosialidase/Bacterial surface protein, Ig-like domain